MPEETITVEAVKQAVATESHSITNDEIEKERNLHRLRTEQAGAFLASTEQQGLMKMRGNWSFWILFFICLISFSNILLIFLIGAGIFHFDGKFEVPFFIGDSLLKILGLAYLIVNFLFNPNTLFNNHNGKKD